MQYCSNGWALNMADYLSCCFPLREDQKPTVIIKCGKIVGKLRETQNGRDFIAFTSIPYAEPPQGKQMKDFFYTCACQNIIFYLLNPNFQRD